MRLIDADALIEFCAERWIPLNIDAVNMQPTAQPEQRWIPCSERLPSKDGKYIVTEKRYAVDDRNHDGKHTVIVEEVNWWGKWERAKFYEVTAWMPLPAPYEVK